jgi:hypothetical protein
LFEDLIEFHIGIESALQTAASHEKAAIDDHIEYLERKLCLEPEEYAAGPPFQQDLQLRNFSNLGFMAERSTAEPHRGNYRLRFVERSIIH